MHFKTATAENKTKKKYVAWLFPSKILTSRYYFQETV
jgi:hypothetical protein